MVPRLPENTRTTDSPAAANSLGFLFRLTPRLAACALLLVAALRLVAESPPAAAGKRIYAVEWRLIRAGTVTLEFGQTHASMHLESSGIVSTLFKVNDLYTADYDEPYCATSAVMDSTEGKRRHETRVTYDRARSHAWFVERDLMKNTVIHEAETEIPNCVSDVVGAMLKLRGLNVQAGQSTQLPVSDGRKSALVKIQAHEREDVKTPSGTYHTIRYEADLMNGVVYQRKGHVDIWLTDDARRLGVQIRLRMSFPVGTVTLQLEKEETP
jgi:Protein of unknown function (DUF3108)